MTCFIVGACAFFVGIVVGAEIAYRRSGSEIAHIVRASLQEHRVWMAWRDSLGRKP